MLNRSSTGAEQPSLPAWDSLTTGIGLLDADLRVVQANPAFCELCGIGISRLQGMALSEIAEPFQYLAKRALQRSHPITQRAMPLAIGAARSISVDAVASPWPAGGVLLELHQLGAVQASAPSSRVSESLRGLAHEVKNPLAGVRGAAQLLRRRVTDPDLAHLADLIIAEADRLTALADRLLHARGKPHLAQINIHEIIERARALVSVESPVDIERDYDPSLPPLRADGDRLQQLLLNLLRNAVQAQATRIQLRTRADHNVLIVEAPARLALRVEVIDNGVGVPEALRDLLFLPLVSGRADGTGLGLAVAQEIAQEHAGSLRHDRRNASTVFTLALPLGGEHG